MRTCALIGASDFNAEQFREMDEAGAFDYVIAVDRGYAALGEIDRKPDVALGDFDSLGYVPTDVRSARVSAKKAKSDMELALDRARSLRYDTAVVFGALGGRLDHTLANLQVLSAASERGLSVSAIGMNEAVFFVTGPNTFEAPARESGTVSVFSMSDEATGVFERGLEWELDDVVLTSRTSLGLSNELIGEPVMIGVESGTIAVIYPL